jgi:S-formylglutathione hydrolase FrmB
MKNGYFTIIIMCLLFSTSVFGRGTVRVKPFHSESLGMEVIVQIYLPDGYSLDGEVNYPVIYFLHGAGIDYDGYTEMFSALDTLVGEEIEPVIVVKPRGLIGQYGRLSWWSDSELNGLVETFVVQDLVEYAEANYAVISDRSSRTIMGHSMGGYGAMRIALEHPDKFCGVVSHSGVVHSTSLIQDIYIPEMLDEHGGEGPYNPNEGTFSLIIFSLAAAFTPNLDNAPYYVDLPIDNDGNIIDDIWSRWIEEDPSYLVSQLDSVDFPSIYIDACVDEGVFPSQNDAFSDSLDAFEIPYTKLVFQGSDHHRDLPQRYPTSFAFMDSIMHLENAGVSDETVFIPNACRMLPAFPNPFNSSTTIQFQITKRTDVSIEIYDCSGRIVKSLFDGNRHAGTHTEVFTAMDLPSGIYFVKLMTPQHILAIKTTLIR